MLAPWWQTDWIGNAFTVIGLVLAVSIAFWVQRRDFDRRAAEARIDDDARALSVRDQWRRTVVTRAFAVAQEAAAVGFGLEGVTRLRVTVELAIDAARMEFRLDPEPGGDAVGQWFHRMATDLMRRQSDASDQEGYMKGLSATLQHELTQWGVGNKPSEDFARM